MALTSVAVVIPHRPAMFELGVVQEVFGVDRTDDGVPRIDFRVCAERPGEPIDLENGMSMTAPYGLDAAEGADLLIAPAYDNDERPSEAVLDVFRRAHARGAWLLSVCTGAFLFGEAGLLDGRSCTTHWMHTEELKQRFPAATVDPDVLFVEDDRWSRALARRPASTRACTTSGASSVPQSRTRSPGGWWYPRSETAASASTSTYRSRAATQTASLPC